MNNLFGIGILLELRDQVSERLRRVSSSMENVQTEAERTVRSFNDLDRNINNASSSLGNISSATSNIRDEFRQTSSYTRSLERQMQKLSAILGGEVPESTKQAYIEMFNLRREIERNQRAYGSWSIEAMEARNNLNKWALGLDDATFKQVFMQSQLGLSNWQLSQQANSIKLNARMTKLMSSQTEILTNRMKGLARHGVTPEMLMPPSTPGQFQLMNETIQASQSPLYKLNAGYRALGHRIEGVIKNFSAQKVAIRMAKGDMVKYGLILRGIQGGLMNLGIAFPLVGMAAVGMYKGIFNIAISTDEKLQELIETVKGKLLKAFEPMLNIVRDLTRGFLEFVGKVADMIIEFNKAHPLCAKLIQGFMLLLPALTMLLLPLTFLNIGLNSIGVALNFLWTLIGPFVAGIGGASSMALALAVALGTVTLVLANLWKSNDKFRNAIIGAWENIKEAVSNAIDSVINGINVLIKAFNEGGLPKVLEVIGEAFTNTFNNIMTNLAPTIEKFNGFMNQLSEVIAKHLPVFLEKGKEILTNVINGIVEVLPKIIETGSQIISTLATTIMELAPKVYEAFRNLISNLAEHIKTGVQVIVPVAVDLITRFISTVADVFPKVVEVGSQILSKLVQGISEIGMTLIETLGKALVDNAPKLFESAKDILVAIGEGIINNLGILLDGALTIITGLIEAIAENLPLVLGVAVQFMTQLVTFIMDNLPILLPLGLQIGLQIITAILSGVLENLPQIIPIAVELINMFVLTIGENLPMILDVGVQLILMLITAISENLPLIMGAVMQIVMTLVQTLIQARPQILACGVQLIVDLASGLLQALPQLISAGVQLILNLISTIAGLLPQFLEKGREIIDIMKQGIDNKKENAKQAMKGVVDGIKNSAKEGIEAFVTIGGDIISGLARGISNGLSKVTKAISGVVSKAISTGKKILGINSPSKVFKQIGAWTSEGMSIGIDNKAPMVTRSVGDMGQEAIGKAKQVLQQDLVLNTGIIDGLENLVLNPKIENNIGLEDLNLSPRTGGDTTGARNNDKVQEIKDTLYLNTGIKDTMSSLGNKPTNSPVENSTSNNITNNFTINMDVKGTESPKDLVDKLVVELQRRTQLKNTLLYNR